MISKYEQDYLALCRKVLCEGVWVLNKRTGKRCLTIPEHTLTYDVGLDSLPLLTTKRSYPVAAFAEVLGYLRRIEWADQFEEIGAKTWYTNANETKSWLDNEHRLGKNHIGKVYGAALEEWELPQLFDSLMKNEDDRGLMINYWKPEKFHLGSLRPCMYSHTFTIIEGTLHMTSNQRSMDLGLGGNFNSIQCYTLLAFFAKITGLKAGKVRHHIVNCHIYESHMDSIIEQLTRTPTHLKVDFEISDWVQTFDDLLKEGVHAREYFKVSGYTPQSSLPMELVP